MISLISFLNSLAIAYLVVVLILEGRDQIRKESIENWAFIVFVVGYFKIYKIEFDVNNFFQELWLYGLFGVAIYSMLFHRERAPIGLVILIASIGLEFLFIIVREFVI